jgi:hypothetical protein
MDVSWPVIIAGALVGLSVGMTGMGGGALMTPIMVLGFGVSPTAAVGSDLAASVAMKPVGALVHHRARTVRWDIVRWLLPTALPAGLAGAFLISRLSGGQAVQDRLKWAIGAALLLAVAGIFARAVLARRRNQPAPDGRAPVRPVLTLLIGLVGGLIVGITSVGSGSLIIVMLMLTHPRLRANELVGTDLVQAIPLAAAAAGHLIFGDTQLGLAGAVLVGALPGIYLGARIATRAADDVLRAILATLLLGSGLAMWGVPGVIILFACGGMAAAAAAVMFAQRRSRDPADLGREEPAPARTALRGSLP